MAYYYYYIVIAKYAQMSADTIGRAVKGVSLWPFTGWECRFKSRPRLECLSLVSVVCCHAEISASG
jgi:hypothetical protein